MCKLSSQKQVSVCKRYTYILFSRVFGTQDFCNHFNAVQVETFTWTSTDWLSEPRDASRTWDGLSIPSGARGCDALAVQAVKRSAELGSKCDIPLPLSHFLKNRRSFLWHFSILSHYKPIKLPPQFYTFREIVRTKEHIVLFLVNGICISFW